MLVRMRRRGGGVPDLLTTARCPRREAQRRGRAITTPARGWASRVSNPIRGPCSAASVRSTYDICYGAPDGQGAFSFSFATLACASARGGTFHSFLTASVTDGSTS